MGNRSGRRAAIGKGSITWSFVGVLASIHVLSMTTGASSIPAPRTNERTGITARRANDDPLETAILP